MNSVLAKELGVGHGQRPLPRHHLRFDQAAPRHRGFRARRPSRTVIVEHHRFSSGARLAVVWVVGCASIASNTRTFATGLDIAHGPFMDGSFGKFNPLHQSRTVEDFLVSAHQFHASIRKISCSSPMRFRNRG